MAKLANPRPGDVLREDYLIPLGKTADWLTKGLQMPLPEVVDILSGKRPITAPIALRLHRFFGASAEFWMHYQAAYDLEEALSSMADELLQIERCRMPHLSYDESGEIVPIEADGAALPQPVAPRSPREATALRRARPPLAGHASPAGLALLAGVRTRLSLDGR